MSQSYVWDENSVRYRLVKTNPGQGFNWLFFPGGPGGDSSYFLSLLNQITLPGNTWLVDLPANGSNEVSDNASYDFNQWYDCFLPAIKKFPNPIYVGHSFGGMFPLLFPDLETILTGFVILNSAPSLWLEEAAKIAAEKKIPILTSALDQFEKNPNSETFKAALDACMPYYFPPHSIEQGKAILADVIFNYHASAWWLKKATEIQFNAVWIPQNVPTVIISGSEDCIVPSVLFERDQRFQRPNIFYKKIEQAGHAPWVEDVQAVKTAFDALIAQIG